MRHIRSIAVLVVVVSAALFAGAGDSRIHAEQDRRAGQGRRARAVPGQLIVKYRAGVAAPQKGRARGRARASALARLRSGPEADATGETEVVSVPSDLSTDIAAAALRDDPDVLYVEPNWVYTRQQAGCPGTCPADPLFGRQWALHNAGQLIGSNAGGRPDADVDAPEAWSRTRGSSGVYIGVLDEGVDLNHEDLGVQPGGPIWTNPFDPPDGRDNDGNGYVDDVHGWDFANRDNTIYDGGPADPATDAHGTAVAGIIGAGAGNGIGIAGLNWDVTIIPAKFMTPQGGTTAGAVEAIDYFIDLKTRHGLNIVAINSSWGSGGFSQALLDAITRAARHDILFVVAAGNGGDDGLGDDNDRAGSYPANYDTTAGAGYDSVISVAATDRFDGLAGWSNFGAVTVDLAAPGELTLTTAPQDGYVYESGTSMAAPHVTGAAALIHAARALRGRELRAALLERVDPLASLQGRSRTGGRLNVVRSLDLPAPPSGGDVVLHAKDAVVAGGGWSLVADATAAGGARLQNADAGAAKRGAPLAAPPGHAELAFEAEAGVPYRLWIRGKANLNRWASDSVFVQFDGAVDGGGSALYRIGTTAGATVNLEECSGCGLAGWGWQDNGYGAGVLGPVIRFAKAGVQRLRIQAREDGLGIDQVVLSPGRFLSGAPGNLKHDATVLAAAGGVQLPATGPAPAPPASGGEIVLYAAQAPVVSGNWKVVADATAAGGARLQSTNLGAAKVVTALAAPAHYFELTFSAASGTAYHLWLRGKATGNHYANDSVHVQFDRSVDRAGAARSRIGSAASAEVNLEDCSGCGVAGWGWQDNGYGAGVMGQPIYFATAGTQRVRVQVREDGFGIDQIVLSPVKHLTKPPGAPKNDTTIVPR
jgi:subtilisin family serine protease